MTAHGARPPKRVIRREVQDKLAEKLLDGTGGRRPDGAGRRGGWRVIAVPRGGYGHGRRGVGGGAAGAEFRIQRRPEATPALLRCVVRPKHRSVLAQAAVGIWAFGVSKVRQKAGGVCRHRQNWTLKRLVSATFDRALHGSEAETQRHGTAQMHIPFFGSRGSHLCGPTPFVFR